MVAGYFGASPRTLSEGRHSTTVVGWGPLKKTTERLESTCSSALGLQDGLNSHIKPQSRVCFKDGATPDKWDRVTTGYDAEALKELGEHLGVEGLAPEDGGARRPTTRHSFTIVAS